METKLIRTVVLGILFVMIMAVLGVFYVYRHYETIQVGKKLKEATQVLLSEEKENKRLQAEFETLKEEVVRTRDLRRQLGMRYPGQKETIVFTSKRERERNAKNQ